VTVIEALLQSESAPRKSPSASLQERQLFKSAAAFSNVEITWAVHLRCLRRRRQLHSNRPKRRNKRSTSPSPASGITENGCSSLCSSSIPISLKDAKVKGYTPCKIYHPPE
jgi:hypothetical protein